MTWARDYKTINVLDDEDNPPGHQVLLRLGRPSRSSTCAVSLWGGCDIVREMHAKGELAALVTSDA